MSPHEPGIIVIPNPPEQGDFVPASDTELEIQRRNTLAFIDANPIWVDLLPFDKVDTPDGGFKLTTGTPRASQKFRLLPQSDIMPQVQTPDGVQLTPTYVLLGTWDCEMERWDKFFFNDVWYRIVSPIRPDHTATQVYERKADVARF